MSYDENELLRLRKEFPSPETKRNRRKADDARWARTRAAFNTRMAKDDALYARMTRRQRQQVQVDSGLRPRKQGHSHYVGGKAMTLAGLRLMAARMAEQLAREISNLAAHSHA